MRWHCHVDHGIRIDATGRSLLGLLSAQIRPQHMSSSIGWTPFRPSCCNPVGDVTSLSPLLWTTDPRYLNSSACFDYLAVQVDLAYLLLDPLPTGKSYTQFFSPWIILSLALSRPCQTLSQMGFQACVGLFCLSDVINKQHAQSGLFATSVRPPINTKKRYGLRSELW